MAKSRISSANFLRKPTQKKKKISRHGQSLKFTLRDDNTYVVNVAKKYISGESNGRSFFCEDLYKVQQCLGHPVYNSVSFRAQMCYNFARKALIADGVIQAHEYPLTLDESDRPAMITPEQKRDFPDFDDEYDFDFTE